MLSWRRGVVLAVVAVVVVAVVLFARAQRVPEAAGVVLNGVTGQPVAGATVAVDGDELTADHIGEFPIDVDQPTLARVTAEGFLPRVVAVQPGLGRSIPMTPSKETVSLRFGGDVMMGRRYYETSIDSKPWLRVGADARAHGRILSAVKPLLDDADLTVVNLESALVKGNPYFTKKRPVWAHPDKALIFATSVEFAAAMKNAGIDVVDLANNHLYDALDHGVVTTRAALDRAGIVHFGAGMSIAEAWRPAFVQVRDQTVGFVGCTTIDGDQYDIHYVAEPGKGGAALCHEERLRSAIKAAKARADVVVFMLHGGREYHREFQPDVQSFSHIAAEAGATVVVDGHPHVIGGFTQHRGVPIANSMGNLLFDQPLWDTFVSYLFRADVRDGKAVTMTADPIALAGYRPVPVIGPIADVSSRIAAAHDVGPMTLAPGMARAPALGKPDAVALDGRVGAVKRLPAGASVNGAADVVRPGRDLLWGTGSMEDLDTDPASGEALLWFLGKYARVVPSAACEGVVGVQLDRSPVSEKDVIVSPLHRQAVEPGAKLTLIARVRQASPGAKLALHWYLDDKGGSVDVTSVGIPRRSLKEEGCSDVRLDATVPPEASYAQPFVRLSPPGGVHNASSLRVDDIRMIQWSTGPATPLDDTVEFRRAGKITLTQSR